MKMLGKHFIIDTNVFRRKVYLFDSKINSNYYYMSYFTFFELMDALVMKKISDEEKDIILYAFELLRMQKVILIKPKVCKNLEILNNFMIEKEDEYVIFRNFFLEHISFTMAQFIATILIYILLGVVNSVKASSNYEQYRIIKYYFASFKKYDELNRTIRKMIVKYYQENSYVKNELNILFTNELKKILESLSYDVNIIKESNGFYDLLQKVYVIGNLKHTENKIEDEFIYYYCYIYAKDILENKRHFHYNDIIDVLNVYHAYKYNYYYMTQDEKLVKFLKKIFKNKKEILGFLNNQIYIISQKNKK